jgi:protein-L-isoaspartate O-methyltransferase
MLLSGERQVSPTIEDIRRDHVARYDFAASLLPKGSTVADYACGIGYGSLILASAGHTVTGFDVDEETLEYARKNYNYPNVEYVKNDGENPDIKLQYDAAVCFETIEHIQDPRPLLKALRQSCKQLIASVPNEDVMPFEMEPGKTYAFHHRHYTKKEFNDLLTECGWQAVQWHGQMTDHSDVEQGVNGRTTIAVCEPVAVPEALPEKHIAILGLGPSLDQYLELTKRAGGRHKLFSETWAINALGDVFACDIIFHMDDIRIQEIRAKAKPQSNIAAMVDWIKHSPVPIVTSRSHEAYPALVEFPLEDILNDLGHDYFNNTAAYAVAFAIHTGATIISLFGMDYTYPNVHDAEKGRACVEFWLGQAHARGIKINLPKTTTLMDSMYPRASRLYGYDTLDVEFNVQPDGYLKLDFKPLEKLPTAEQIEANYDHSAPIKDQHQALKVNA